MTNARKIQFVQGVVIGGIAAVLLVTILTIAGDLYAPLKTFLKNAHHHHWVGKGIWATGLFLLVAALCFIPAPHATPETLARRINLFSWLIIVGSVVLFLFFVYEYIR